MTAPIIAIRFASSDLVNLATPPIPGVVVGTTTQSSPLATTTPPSSQTDGPKQTETGAPTDTGGGNGLSSGVIAGIAVGGAAAFALLAALVFFILRQRRSSQAEHDAPPEVERVETAPPKFHPPTQSTALYELPGHGGSGLMHVAQPHSYTPELAGPTPNKGYDSLAISETHWQPSPGTDHGSRSEMAASPTNMDVLTVPEAPASPVADHSDRSELEVLRQRQSQIAIARERLLRLQDLDAEEEMVQRRIEALARGGRDEVDSRGNSRLS